METPQIFDHNLKSGAGRIAKVMARAGVCSRRDAERLIADGRVTLNGKTVPTPAINVTGNDVICVDGRAIAAPDASRLWRYHKRKGEVTTRHDPQGRPTVFDRLPEELPRLIAIGRLDYNTEGLLLMTNDGGLSRHLELPSTGWMRRYRVRVHGTPDPAALKRLGKGVEIDGVRYAPIEATFEREQGSNAWLTVALREGKNREVRKIMEHLGLQVTRLLRVSFGPFALESLDVGQIEEVKPRVLATQLGATLAAELGLRPASSTQLKPRQRPERADRAAPGAARAKAGPKAAGGEEHPAKTPRFKTFKKGPAAGAGRPVSKGARPERFEVSPDSAPAVRQERPGRKADSGSAGKAADTKTFRKRPGSSEARGAAQGARAGTAERFKPREASAAGAGARRSSRAAPSERFQARPDSEAGVKTPRFKPFNKGAAAEGGAPSREARSPSREARPERDQSSAGSERPRKTGNFKPRGAPAAGGTRHEQRPESSARFPAKPGGEFRDKPPRSRSSGGGAGRASAPGGAPRSSRKPEGERGGKSGPFKPRTASGPGFKSQPRGPAKPGTRRPPHPGGKRPRP